eukprot:TRINITY_DN90334_c0_g1_i1.p1 TRINITY_DN90334_c0_g1~~TRINITY_DN90334_c0_g1_i1.p1  ORF type:complete len:723 (-),score=321.66 TRINITY_DN90334_c0_g1_i1:114-2198(-)
MPQFAKVPLLLAATAGALRAPSKPAKAPVAANQAKATALLSVTPVEKVITLLGQLQEQVSEGGAKEAAEYDKFACFCKNQADFKTHAIERSNEEVEKLKAKIEKLDADLAALNSEITELGTKIDTLTTDITTETEARTEQHEKYAKDAKEMEESIDAVERAIQALKASKAELKGAKVDFAQLQHIINGNVPAKQQSLIAALLGNKQSPASYEFSSNDIIATLKDLHSTFKANKKELDEAEFASMDASNKKTLGMTNQKKFAEKAKAQKEAIVGAMTEDKAEAEADKTAEENAAAADEEFKAELTTQCEQRATEFDQRSKARASELTALAEAMESLKTGVASNWGANRKLASAASLLQVGSDSNDAKQLDAVKRAMESLNLAASKSGSPTLSALAAKVLLKEDHFVKVRGIIKDLVARLEAAAEEEATQKSFCDKEMKKAVTMRDEQQLAVEEEATTISEKTAEVAKLKEEIATLAKEIAELNKALNEATELRSGEKATNEQTIADAGAGKEAVDKAMETLKTFYGGAAAAFLQSDKYVPPKSDREGKTVSDRAPKMSYSGEYKGRTSESGGIIGLLEVISADFERTKTTVTDEEAAAVEAFTKFETETKESIDAKKTEKEGKEGDVTSAEEAITTAQDALVDAKRLHKGALEELTKLKAMCVDAEESYEQRVAKREREIDSLKEALQILEDWNK